MSERFTNEMQRELASCLEPVCAPASLWYRVDAELTAPPARGRSIPRLALVAGLLLVAAVAAGWYFDGRGGALALPALEARRELTQPVQGAHRSQGARAPGPTAPVNGQHACLVCHG